MTNFRFNNVFSSSFLNQTKQKQSEELTKIISAEGAYLSLIRAVLLLKGGILFRASYVVMLFFQRHSHFL